MMTENKRFTFADGFKIVAIRDNGEIMNSIQVCEKLNELYEENKELKKINQDNQDYISSLEKEKSNLQIKLQKIRDYAIEEGEVKQGVIEKVILNE